MVDVSAKAITRRRATASGRIRLAPATVALVAANRLAKGNVLAVAELAGIQAAKHTFELIPLCHGLVLDKVGVRAALDADGVAVVSEIVCTGRTGAEMEALTAVAVALLTVYDMCKAVDRSMVLEGIRLLDKKKEAV
jgi:cyclic pyranopterin phosphate synthase